MAPWHCLFQRVTHLGAICHIIWIHPVFSFSLLHISFIVCCLVALFHSLCPFFFTHFWHGTHDIHRPISSSRWQMARDTSTMHDFHIDLGRHKSLPPSAFYTTRKEVIILVENIFCCWMSCYHFDVSITEEEGKAVLAGWSVEPLDVNKLDIKTILKTVFITSFFFTKKKTVFKKGTSLLTIIKENPQTRTASFKNDD